jgi:carboxypeptidase Taq
MTLSANTDFQQLTTRFREWSLLNSCASLLGWDERTYLPPGGVDHRAQQMTLLARMGHEALTAPEMSELLERVEGACRTDSPNLDAAATLREIRRLQHRAVKLPRRLVEELAGCVIHSQQGWQEARQASDFASFQPWLEKIVALKREEAQAVTYRDSPYDALLDEYEPGATARDIRALFADLRAELTPLIAGIVQSGKHPDRTILARSFPADRQEKFGKAAAELIGFDFASGRLDITTHPFCCSIGPGDCRITTRYHPQRFGDGFFGILHEAGHGIYEQGLDPRHFGLPLGMHASLGIHESQSRLWENQVGRSRSFWEFFLPQAQQAFSESLGGLRLDAFLAAVNDVRPSYIRVEADEATYNLHVILRFELEEALLRGDLQPADVPDAWNEKFKESFGIVPPDAAQGCLQDIHWSMGGLGYFPTYTLGNLYAAQFMEQARRDLGDLDADFRRGEFGRLKSWLNSKIHQQGMRYRAGDLCAQITGKSLSHRPFMHYLREKFSPLYGL